MRARLTIGLLFSVIASLAMAADVVVYRCTGADGHVSLQDTPCDAAANEERRLLRAPAAPPPAPVGALARDSAQPAEMQTPSPETNVMPATPPPLWLCERYDGKTYESSTGIPQRHWVPLWALGADPRAPATALDPDTIGQTSPLRPRPGGGTPTLSVSAMTLGTWVEDVCTQLTPTQICAHRRQELAGYGRRIFNAGQSEGDRLRDEQAALRLRIAQECG